jgi:uncharacterized protein (DUF305 family)
MKQSIFLMFLALIFLSCKGESDKEQIKGDDSAVPHAKHHDASQSNEEISKSMAGMMDKIHQIEKTGNTDYDIAATMIEHHKGAIDMIASHQSQDPALQRQAEQIKTRLEGELQQLQRIAETTRSLSANYDLQETEKGVGKDLMTNMMTMMETVPSKATIDQNFVAILVKHHRDGVDLASIAVKHAKDKRLKTLAETIIRDREASVVQLEAFVK